MTLALDLTKSITIDTLKITDYKVQYFHPTITLPNFPDRKIFDLTELVESISWDYDKQQAPVHAAITFQHHENLKDIVGVGGIITIFGYALSPDSMVFDEILRLHIIDTDLSTEGSSATAPMTIECFDSMWYLINNDHAAKFVGKKASEIIISLCEEFSIRYKDNNGKSLIEDTGATIPRLIFRKNTLYDMMIVALTESRFIDGQRYMIRMEKGILRVIKKTLPSKVFVLAHGENIYAASLTKSLSGMKNRIRLFSNQPSGSDLFGLIDQTLGSATANDMPVLQAQADDEYMQKYYGVLQQIETGQSPDRFSNEQEYAEHLLQSKSKVSFKGNISAPNINTLRWGDPIYIYEPRTQMVGQYYIISGKHTVSRADASMDLVLHYEDALPEQFFEQFENAGTKDILDRILKQAGLPATNQGSYYYSPVLGRYPISQEFGSYPNNGFNGPLGHTGIDIACPDETVILATAAGTVKWIGEGNGDSLAGFWIKLDHGNGIESVYAHMDPVGNSVVRIGQHVDRSQTLGSSNHTGAATGPHLHFEFRKNGVPVNPRDYVLFGPAYTIEAKAGSGLVNISELRDLSIKFGGDPFLVAAVAWRESNFVVNAKGDETLAQAFPLRAKNGYCSWGIFQENICNGAGYTYISGGLDGKKHTVDEMLAVDGQVQRFIARIKGIDSTDKTPGQIAAEAQRPTDQAGYAVDINALYLKFKTNLANP